MMSRKVPLTYCLMLLLALHEIGANICYDELDLCSHCNVTHAVCNTGAPDLIIPNNLSTSIRHLVVHYDGPLAKLTSSMIARYPHLEQVTLTGRISSIASETLSHLGVLKELTISDTLIKELPGELFHQNNTLESLQLHRNELSRIPSDLFSQVKHLKTLNLAYNNILHPNCSSIGENFRYLSNLTYLNLASMTVNHSCDDQIAAGFFNVVEESVVNLNVSKTNVFNGDQSLLRNFSRLSVLDITLAEGFHKCPGSAEEMFWNLPPALEHLFMRRWSPFTLDSRFDCTLTAANIKGLTALPNLRELDVKYGDLMFGYELTADVFDGFMFLEILNLEWCRFSNIADNVFQRCPSLRRLSIKGNPIGNRPFSISAEPGSCQLRSLNLGRAALFSEPDDDFKLHFMLNSCKIQGIDLTGNLLKNVPIFFRHGFSNGVSNNINGALYLNSIILDQNYLETLQMHFDWEFSGFCFYMSNLVNLSLRKNKLFDIQGLCLSLTHLYLGGNKRLEENWGTNEAELSKLKNLQVLELAENDLDRFSPSAFNSMTNLRIVYFGKNNLTEISTEIFSRNTKLEVIDLHFNRLREIRAAHVSHLIHLRRLDLRNNQILTLDNNLVDYFEQTLALQFILLKDNPLTCRCDDQHTQYFIKTTNKIPSAQKLTCSGPQKEHGGQKVFKYSRDTFYCDHRENIIIAFSVLGGFAVTLLIALPCYKYRWYLTHAKTVAVALTHKIKEVRFHHKCEYDAIVIYNSKSEDDCDFVANHLCLEVEKEAVDGSTEIPLKLYVVDRNSAVGAPVYTSLISALESSRKIIIVLSNAFLDSELCKGQSDIAGHEAYGQRVYEPNRIVVLVREELDEDCIRSPFNALLSEVVIDVYGKDERAMKRVWKRLRNFVSKPKYEFMKKPRIGNSSEDIAMDGQ